MRLPVNGHNLRASLLVYVVLLHSGRQNRKRVLPTFMDRSGRNLETVEPEVAFWEISSDRISGKIHYNGAVFGNNVRGFGTVITLQWPTVANGGSHRRRPLKAFSELAVFDARL
jgi:hypothetical protein